MLAAIAHAGCLTELAVSPSCVSCRRSRLATLVESNTVGRLLAVETGRVTVSEVFPRVNEHNIPTITSLLTGIKDILYG